MSLVSEIAADSPTHWWKFDSVIGGVVADSGSGTANPLTVTGTLTGATGPDSGGGQRFDSGDYATGASSADMPSGAQAFTFAGFVAPDALSGDQTFFGFGAAATGTSAFLGIPDGVPRCGFYSNDMTGSASALQAGGMIHLAASYDGSLTAYLFLNAALIATKTFASPLNITASAPFVGRLGVNPFGQEFTGTAAHFYLFTGAMLAPERIAAHYFASDAPIWLPEPSATQSLQSASVRQATAAAVHFPIHHIGL